MPNDPMLVELDASKLLVLHDSETVRFNLPPLPLAGLPEPLRIHFDLDRSTVEDLLRRLTELYAHMAPPGGFTN